MVQVPLFTPGSDTCISRPRLTYFDVKGLGEPVRLMLAYAGVDFEDRRVRFEEWGKIKVEQADSLPGNKQSVRRLPVLELPGESRPFTQSKALFNWAANKAGIIPSEEVKLLRVDEISFLCDEAMSKIQATFFLAEDDKKPARAKLVSEYFPKMLAVLEGFIECSSSKPGYAVGDSTTIADFWVSFIVDFLSSGFLPEIPTDCVNSDVAPLSMEVLKRVMEEPRIKTYLEERELNKN